MSIHASEVRFRALRDLNQFAVSGRNEDTTVLLTVLLRFSKAAPCRSIPASTLQGPAAAPAATLVMVVQWG